MKNIVIIDTNVLLSDPDVLFLYPDAEVIVPQVVLAELDKVKMVRADKEVRFRGREVSRILFELSKHGVLTDGVELDNNSVIRVAQTETQDLPKNLSPRNADDRIIGCAILEAQSHPDAHVLLLTNDLNMLLKAQTHGIDVARHEHEFKLSLFAKLMQRLGQRRLTLWWIIVPISLAGILVSLWLFVPSPIPLPTSSPTLNLTSYPLREVEYLNTLKNDSANFQTWFQLGQLYSNWAQELESRAQFDSAREKLNSAVSAYKRALSIKPTSAAVHTNLGTAYLVLGNTDEAISQFVQASSYDPGYALAHFNLGFTLLTRNRDFTGAAKEFETYLRLEPSGERSEYARQKLKEIRENNNAI
ncbi:MAG TPA: tetratricopeptide repeat protein [Actinobacteria bacterium]|nr:tetratricopeptide repeat protein [Actinomycetota bacterium]